MSVSAQLHPRAKTISKHPVCHPNNHKVSHLIRATDMGKQAFRECIFELAMSHRGDRASRGAMCRLVLCWALLLAPGTRAQLRGINLFGCPPSNASAPVECVVTAAYGVNPGSNPLLDPIFGSVRVVGVAITTAPFSACPSPFLSNPCTGSQVVQAVMGSVDLVNGASVAVPSLTLNVTGMLLVDANSSITASGIGVINAYESSYGIGGGGGGHGGTGATLKACGHVATGGVSSLRASGALTPATAFVFGGGAVYDSFHGGKNIGSRGGGRIWIIASDMLEVDGMIAADGASFEGGQLATGGGAGGTVIIETAVLSGVGYVSAQGGNSVWGGGAGGVIMIMTLVDPGISGFVSGGSSDASCDVGSPGIMYLAAIASLQCGPANAVPYLIAQTQISTLPATLSSLQVSDCNWVLPAALPPLATASFFNSVVQMSHTLNVSGAVSLSTGTYLQMANGASILAGSLDLRHSLIKMYDETVLVIVVATLLQVDSLSYIHFTTSASITANTIVLQNTLTQEDLSTQTSLSLTAQSITSTIDSSIIAWYISITAASMVLAGSITGVAANQQICLLSFPTLPCLGGAVPTAVRDGGGGGACAAACVNRSPHAGAKLVLSRALGCIYCELRLFCFACCESEYDFSCGAMQSIEHSGTIQSGATAICATNLTMEGTISGNDFGCDPQQVRAVARGVCGFMGLCGAQGPGKGSQRSSGASSGAGHASTGGSGCIEQSVAQGGKSYDNVSLPALVGSGGGGPNGGQGAGFIAISAELLVHTGLIQSDGMPGLYNPAGGGGGGAGGTVIIVADELQGAGSFSVVGGSGGRPGGGGGSGGILYAEVGWSFIASPFTVFATGGAGNPPGMTGGSGLAWAVVRPRARTLGRRVLVVSQPECGPGHQPPFCTPCGVGYFKPNDGNTFCGACPPGSATSGLGSTSCAPCVGNSYAKNPGSAACASCGIGVEASLCVRHDALR